MPGGFADASGSQLEMLGTHCKSLQQIDYLGQTGDSASSIAASGTEISYSWPMWPCLAVLIVIQELIIAMKLDAC